MREINLIENLLRVDALMEMRMMMIRENEKLGGIDCSMKENKYSICWKIIPPSK